MPNTHITHTFFWHKPANTPLTMLPIKAQELLIWSQFSCVFIMSCVGNEYLNELNTGYTKSSGKIEISLMENNNRSPSLSFYSIDNGQHDYLFEYLFLEISILKMCWGSTIERIKRFRF